MPLVGAILLRALGNAMASLNEAATGQTRMLRQKRSIHEKRYSFFEEDWSSSIRRSNSSGIGSRATVS